MHSMNDMDDTPDTPQDMRRLIVLLVFMVIAAMPIAWLSVDERAGDKLLHLSNTR